MTTIKLEQRLSVPLHPKSPGKNGNTGACKGPHKSALMGLDRQPFRTLSLLFAQVASQSARANLPVYYSKQNETANYHLSCRIICVFPLNEGRMPLWVPVKTGWGLWQTPCKYSCSMIVVSAGCDMHVVNGRCPHNWCYPLCCPCNLHPPTPGALQVRLAAGCLQPRPWRKTSSRLLEPSTWFPFKYLSN